jgi:hypothetical protein
LTERSNAPIIRSEAWEAPSFFGVFSDAAGTMPTLTAFGSMLPGDLIRVIREHLGGVERVSEPVPLARGDVGRNFLSTRKLSLAIGGCPRQVVQPGFEKRIGSESRRELW